MSYKNLIVSQTAGNDITINDDGYFLDVQASETPVTVNDTNSVDLTSGGLNGHTLQADVKISATAGNQVVVNADGLFVPASAGSSFILAAEAGTPETVASGDTLTIAAGPLLNTVVSAADTVTISLDTTGATAGQVVTFNGTAPVFATPAGDLTTASNGLTEVGDDVRLGGSLTAPTTITTSPTNTLTVDTGSGAVVQGATNLEQDVNTSLGLAITTQSTSYTVTDVDHTIAMTNTATASVTLPAVTNTRRTLIVKRAPGSTAFVNLVGNVDGNAGGYTLNNSLEAVHLHCNGTTWLIV